MRKFIILTVSIIIVITGTSVSAKPYRLLESESPYTIPQFAFEINLLLGYEKGYIPDYIGRPGLNLGIFDWFMIGGSGTWAYFPDQKERRLAEYEGHIKFRYLSLNFADTKFFAYAKYRNSPGNAFIVPYTGALPNVLAVISPRADSGWDIIGGTSGRLMGQLLRQGFGLMADFNYAWTGGRDYVPQNMANQNRLYLNLTPAWYPNFTSRGPFRKDTLMLGVQNRLTYWFDRGYSYEVMPQISWEFYRNKTASIAMGIPKVTGEDKDYRYLAEINSIFEIFSISAKIEYTPEDFTPDGDGRNDVLYLKPVVKSRDRVKKWTIQIYPENSKKPFKTFQGSGYPPATVQWDGIGNNKTEKVESLHDYRVVLSAEDIHGNSDSSNEDVTVGLLLKKIPKGYRIIITNIEFDTAKDIIKKYSYPIVNRVGSYLKKNFPDYKIIVHGHTDNVGNDAYNLELSKRRAISVRKYLNGRGIAMDRMSIDFFGLRRPIASNANESGRRINRRVEFILTKEGFQHKDIGKDDDYDPDFKIEIIN